MVSALTKLLALVLSCSVVIRAQNTTTNSTTAVASGDYLDGDAVNVTWTATIGQVNKGNGAFMSPSGQVLVLVRQDAVVQAFQPKTGVELWTYTPADPGTSNCFGGATFSSFDGQEYVLFSVTTNAIYVTNTAR
jgi:outer membrane protein assembly factor BamB